MLLTVVKTEVKKMPVAVWTALVVCPLVWCLDDALLQIQISPYLAACFTASVAD